MIPNFNLTDRGFGALELLYGKEIPMQLAAWVRVKMNEMFSKQPMSKEMINYITASINVETSKLVDQGYIKYVDHLNTWVVTMPLFKWVKK
jgi:hypothetical protein